MQGNVTNRNAIVRTRTDRAGKVRTETARRDSGMDVAITTDKRTNRTRVFIEPNGRWKGGLELDGRQAWTLLRALAKHFDAQGKLG